MEKCRKEDCFYKARGYGDKDICHYMLWTGRSRNCPADKCDKYISKQEARRLGMRYGED